MAENPKTNYLEALKLKIYQRTLWIGVIVIGIVWALNNQYQNVENLGPFLYFFFGCYCIAALIFFRIYQSKFLRSFELSGFAFIYLYFVINFYQEVQISLIGTNLGFRKFLLWIAILYAFSFLVFRAKTAIYVSASYLILIVLIGVSYLLQRGISPDLGDDLLMLAQIYGSGLAYIALLYAIAKLKEKYTETEINSRLLSTIANSDTLTGAYSRRKIFELLDFFIEKSKLQNHPLTIMIIDVDKLKETNDSHGHEMGDLVLTRIVEMLRKNLREDDAVGRIGGDEFLIICPNTSENQAMMLAERLGQTISDADYPDLEEQTISIGVAVHQENDSKKTLVNRADQKMYLNKKSKRKLTPII